MGIETAEDTRVHGGRLDRSGLKARGEIKLFTRSRAATSSLDDGCRSEGIHIVDPRHEQAATFAAEGWARVARTPGVAALSPSDFVSCAGRVMNGHEPGCRHSSTS